LADLIETSATTWDSPEYTARLLDLMAPLHRGKVEKARLMDLQVVGTLYRRTRVQDRVRKQRVEVRFDGISGCLRTPSGGSSRQRLLIVEHKLIRSRLMTTREIARLMGLPEDYRLPPTYNDAYHLVGDGVAVPVVRWLSEKLFTPLLSTQNIQAEDEVELLYA
jgi:DNA (cytosine-5)-methyltransferase 1